MTESREVALTPYLHSLRRWLRGGWDLILPPVCVLCDASLEETDFEEQAHDAICTKCQQRLTAEPSPFCSGCGMPMPGLQTRECRECAGRRWHFDSVTHLGLYQGYLREAIIRAKQRGAESLAYALGCRLRKALEFDHREAPDLITCVPMHWRRRLARGINTAACAATAISHRMKSSFAADLLVCKRAIAKQSQLSIAQRRKNVRGAFRVAWGYSLQEASVLIVDDVMTTGATVQELAKVLKAAGVSRVDIAIIARATGRDW